MYLQCVIYKAFGLMNNKYDHEWDAKLNQILNEGSSFSLGDHVLTVSHNGTKYDIWVSNYPYAYAECYKVNENSVSNLAKFRPKISTMCKLRKMQLQLPVELQEKAKIWK